MMDFDAFFTRPPHPRVSSLPSSTRLVVDRKMVKARVQLRMIVGASDSVDFFERCSREGQLLLGAELRLRVSEFPLDQFAQIGNRSSEDRASPSRAL